MASKYIDTTAIIQTIGCVYNNPKLLDYTDKYIITEDDFDNDFHKIVYGSIYKLHELGAESITLDAIGDFLSTRPKYQAIYEAQKGNKWLQEASLHSDNTTFDYYYGRLKKMSLLRAYDRYGFDVSDIYDPDNILDTKKRQLQEEWLDNASLEKIAQRIDDKIEEIKYKYVAEMENDAYQAGNNIDELIDDLLEHPEVGAPLFGPLINTVTRGARLNKFYLRSAATGVGKSRSMIADACYLSCEKYYQEGIGWIKSGGGEEPVLFISTEQTKDEIQTMMLAFLSNVNEDHILNGKYVDDELARVREAAQYLRKANLFVVEMPDFSLRDVENVIKKNIRDHGIKYVFHDYIHTSMKILEEISKRSGGVKLREDNILFMLSTRLKDICNQYGIFIMSATQLNADYQYSETPDQNVLRGSKAIADKIDVGMLLLQARDNDYQSLEKILETNTFERPTIKLSVYKNRRGKYKGIYLWCKADLGCCRIIPIFCTDWSYELVDMENVKIRIAEDSAF